MVIPHFRKRQVNGVIAVLGITKSVKKKPPASGPRSFLSGEPRAAPHNCSGQGRPKNRVRLWWRA